MNTHPITERIALNLFSNPHWTITPALHIGREPGCWGFPGVYWASIEWLRWSWQISLRDLSREEASK